MTSTGQPLQESPEHVRISLAAAMTLGYEPGLFYRDARLYCINLLLTYGSGCVARCAYCGLSSDRDTSDAEGSSFIRVKWPTHELDDVVGRIAERSDAIHRVCVAMVTARRALSDAEEICRRLRSATNVPVSVLVTPTILRDGDLLRLRDAGADKIGVAIDLATAELFDRYRGSGVKGPHEWDRYWGCYEEALEVFGESNAGVHLMVGMGETEEEMCQVIQRSRDLGGLTHLFSFFPECGSRMERDRPPDVGQYRRVQLARYLIDTGRAREQDFRYGPDATLASFGLPPEELEAVISSGEPFRTSGCTGKTDEVACNRPYANSRPGPNLRNYPFPPDDDDLRRIRRQLSRTLQVGETASSSQSLA